MPRARPQAHAHSLRPRLSSQQPKGRVTTWVPGSAPWARRPGPGPIARRSRDKRGRENKHANARLARRRRHEGKVQPPVAPRPPRSGRQRRGRTRAPRSGAASAREAAPGPGGQEGAGPRGPRRPRAESSPRFASAPEQREVDNSCSGSPGSLSSYAGPERLKSVVYFYPYPG
ncbi:hypothetical protein R6Z07F_009234 [Ovis aries]